MLALRQPPFTSPPEATETVAEMEARYAGIAAAVADVAGDDAFAAAAILGVTFEETHWRRDYDLGVGGAVDIRRNRGQWCAGQVNIGNGTRNGVSGPELAASRKLCYEAVLAAIRASFGACRALPRPLWLSAYTSGSCDRGHKASAARMKRIDYLRYAIARASQGPQRH